MYLVNIQLDIIDEIRKLTIDNKDFDVGKWSYEDAETLKQAGEMIKRELNKSKGKL